MTENLLDTCVFLETDVPENTDKLPDSSTEGVRLDVDSEASVRAALNLMASVSGDEFELLLSAGRRPTAAERGTAAHLFLQYCDYSLVSQNGLEEEIARLAEQGFLSGRTAEILDRNMLETFFNSRFFRHMTSAVKLERELKFNRMVPLSSLTAFPALAKLLEGRSLMVRGSVDLLCEFEDGHLELCDYKTDHITPEERRDASLLQARMTEAHRDQLIQYAAAVEEMYGVRPTKAFIFSLPLGEAVEIALEG
jgi:ATP-dependent helicase/nuclease subunit A